MYIGVPNDAPVFKIGLTIIPPRRGGPAGAPPTGVPDHHTGNADSAVYDGAPNLTAAVLRHHDGRRHTTWWRCRRRQPDDVQ